jgi:hypothetical protein
VGERAERHKAQRRLLEQQAVREQRLLAITEMMAKGEWTRDSGPELAERWSLSAEYVKRMAAEASRNLRGAMTRDREQWRQWALETLETKILPRAIQTNQLQAAVAAVREAKEICGFAAPAKVELSGAIAHMTVDDLHRQLAEVSRRATAALAEHEAEPLALLGDGGDSSSISDEDAVVEDEEIAMVDPSDEASGS